MSVVIVAFKAKSTRSEVRRFMVQIS